MPARRDVVGRLMRMRALLWVATAIVMLGPTGAAQAAFSGSLDPSFGNGGVSGPGPNSRLFDTVVQSDGKILAVGEIGTQTGTTLLLARFTSSGSLDPSFGVGGIVRGPPVPSFSGAGSLGRGIAIEPDGKIVAVGTVTTSVGTGHLGLLVERYNQNGSPDSGFGTGGVVSMFTGEPEGDGYAVAIQPDGKIIAAGSAYASGDDGTGARMAVVRLNQDGSPDPSFGFDGSDVLAVEAYSYALAVALQPDGGIVVAGSEAPGQLAPSAVIARLTPSGGFDPSFAGTGLYARQYARSAASSAFNAVAVQPDGKVVAAGSAAHGSSAADTLVVRFSSSGVQDPTFGSGGVVYDPAAVNWTGGTPTTPGANGAVIAPNGDVIAAGMFANSTTTYATLWALKPTGSPDALFGHDGAAVLTNGFGGNTEYAAIAQSATNQDFVAVGDSLPPFNGSYSGIASRYIGFEIVALRLKLEGLRRSYKTATVARHGLKATVGCNQACTFKLSLTISAATARGLRLKVRGSSPVTITSATASLRGSDTKSVTLGISNRNAAVLERRKRVGLMLELSGTSSGLQMRRTTKHAITFTR